MATWLDDATATGRAAIGEEAFLRAWQAGQDMPLDAALAEAMRVLDAASTTGPSLTTSGPAEGRQ